MELSTFSSDLKLSEIRPSELIEEYVSLVQGAVPALFASAENSVCPACGKAEKSEAFEKSGVSYSRCDYCFTLYVAERPQQEELNRFYSESEARSFWMNKIWRDSNQARRLKMFEPMVDWVKSSFESHQVDSSSAKVVEAFAVNPSFSQAWGEKNLLSHSPFFERSDEELGGIAKYEFGSVDAVVLSDALDRAAAPQKVLKWAHETLRSGGVCFVTGILSSGIDVLSLGEFSDTLLPPDRLNSFTFEGFSEMVEQAGFDLVEFSTPGNLDLENMRRSLEKGEIKSDFFTYLFEMRKDPHLLDEFKSFLQMNRLSSSLRAVLKRR